MDPPWKILYHCVPQKLLLTQHFVHTDDSKVWWAYFVEGVCLDSGVIGAISPSGIRCSYYDCSIHGGCIDGLVLSNVPLVSLLRVLSVNIWQIVCRIVPRIYRS